MKIAILADTHWGARGDSPAFLDHFAQFFKNTFFPYMEEHPEIKTVVHVGDLVDRRKVINFVTSNMMRKHYVMPSLMLDLTTHIIAGNHDCFYKNTNQINALRELMTSYGDNFKVYSAPAEVEFDGRRALMLPWICQDNQEEAMASVDKTKATIAFAHLELVGFEMARGQMMEHGMDRKFFQDFVAVYTGHYHHKSSQGNIHYMGSPYEMTWADYDDPKGFHVLDTKTLELEFIVNPNRMHHKIVWDGTNEPKLPDDLKGKIVKVIVDERGDVKKFDKFAAKLDKIGMTDMQVVEKHLNTTMKNDTIVVDGETDTMKILSDYVMGLDVDVDKKELVGLLRELYTEAQVTVE